MRQGLLLLVMLVLAAGLAGQVSLTDFNKTRYQINEKGFLVLGSWSAVNIVSGAIGLATASGQAKYFHEMNLVWGSVNMLVALPGYLGARKRTADNSLAGTVKGQSAIEKTFALNAGLDMAYMAAGAWCLQKAHNSSHAAKYRGFGNSIIIQGAALLLFDATMFTTHNRHGRLLYKVLGSVQAGPNRAGLNINI